MCWSRPVRGRGLQRQADRVDYVSEKRQNHRLAGKELFGGCGTMFKKPRLWIVIACGAFIVAGATGVFAFSDRAEADSLLVASAVILLLGTTAFLVLTVWALAREGVTPLTEKQQEKARVT